MYDCGAMTLDTNGRRANPYWAAPRKVAVSQSGGRAMTLIRPVKRSYKETREQHSTDG